MPISSKRIVSYINESDSPFTVHQIAKALLSPPVKDKKSKTGGKKKKKVSRQDEAYSKINNVLNALYLIGLLERKRKIYFKHRNFSAYGKAVINSSGNAVVRTDEEDEIIIPKEHVNKAHNDDRVEVRITDYRDGVYSGEILRVVERKKEKYFAKVTSRKGNIIYFKLLDTFGDSEACTKIRRNKVESDFAIVRLTGNYISGRQECVVEKYLLSEEEYDIQRIIAKHALPGEHKEYPEIKKIEMIVSKEASKIRKDYRNLFTITIDGETSKDFDDAVSLEKTRKGYILYVHIADVSAFIKKNSELDKEASKRGTSYYLGNTVIPMLPEILSNEFCSLKEGQDRLTITVEIFFDKKARDIKYAFFKSIIRVDKRLTYVSADKLIDDKSDRKLNALLSQMHDLASILKQKRLKEGRIDLDLPDYELIYDKTALKDIKFAERLRSHTIIEEFMLTANEVVSRYLTENNIPALYRIHEDISEEKMLALQNFLRSIGITLKTAKNTGIALQSIIEKVKGREYEKVVNFIILKSFMQAYYGAQPLGHFGLGFADYTHFTSPIRRYPDLIVHRCLKTLIDKIKPVYVTHELEEIGERSSDMERVAQNAERDLFKLISCRYMEHSIGEVFDAVISGISRSGFFVALIDKPVEGMVPLRFLTNDYYLVNEDDYSVIGKRLGKRFRIGDLLRVRLKEVQFDSMRIDFEVA